LTLDKKTKKNLTILKKGIDSTPKLNYNTAMTTNTITADSLQQRMQDAVNYEPKTLGQTNIPLETASDLLAEVLKGKTVRYENEGESSVRDDKFRTFKIENVENIFTAKCSNRRCLTAYMVDLDDGGRDKIRTLHLDGIRVIA
jgi:hypothetical protein